MVTIHDARMILRKKQEIKDAKDTLRRRRRLADFRDRVKNIMRCGVSSFRFYDYEMMQRIKRELDITPSEIRDVLRYRYSANRNYIVRNE
ncbi:hypothetical protein AVV44_gp137 [Cronobacter phage S13]|uniref:Uncharacterized protein n=1 Tax=Cronobacter phage LPCS28 TaxID=2924885 RepID=A0AAE9K6G0_9CAUD|nr:hypothetical protein AVV44_gp137 [Cronobacter phage S13]YP_010665721.1 hypothetical protein PQB73_gp003 [Cronobacter phage LPCS28]AIA64936.1 hypothetical protein S13_137 [Cronobacter phage S13]UNY46910.1 hypothetical protein EHEKIMEA_00003 [Cronobacter phage LPCS28]